MTTYVKTMVRVSYVAMQPEDFHPSKPIVTTGTMKEMRMALDEQYGVSKGLAECMGFTPYLSKYPDDYEGYYTYKSEDGSMDQIRVYCCEYYPYTVYEVKDYEI